LGSHSDCGNISPKDRTDSPHKALELGKDKKLNVYTDSRYAFAMAHVHGAINQERGLLTAEGKTIKNKQEILDLLATLWLPKKLAIIHCPGH
jgi:ribonuclease HI